MIPTMGERIELRNKGSYLTSGPTPTAYHPGSSGHITLSLPGFLAL